MIGFLVGGGVLIAAVLALLLPPLLRRQADAGATGTSELSLVVLREQLADLDREHAAGRIDAAAFARERGELERRALEDGGMATAAAQSARHPLLAAAVALAIPLLAGGLYLMLGAPSALTEQIKPGSHALGPQQIEAMTQRLAERLQENPRDVEGWVMLARSYSVLRRYGEAAAAFGRAAALLPTDAALLADYADTLAMAQGRRLSGEPEKIIAQALQADPNHIKSLALRGSAAFERQDYAAAIADWEKILSLVPPDSGLANGMRNSIADARARLGGGPATAAPAAAAAAPGPSVAGVVTLHPSVQDGGRIAPTDTVFIFARAVDGPRMPLAMLRKTAAELPLRFRLDDSLAMAPNARLASHKQVIVGARISKSGDALAKPGDLEGYSEAVAVGSDKVRIVIGTTVK